MAKTQKKKTEKKNVKKAEVHAPIRTPIVAVMGHVDHGKTTLLDSIRGTNVTEGEAGGITQSTRAHHVTTKSGQNITFIDTPGHEAFSGMRSRGAKITDMVLLVVAADDGVQPQTIESIKFAQEAKVPIVLAINKIDAPGAKPYKIKKELSQHNVLVEEYGGDVIVNLVSALKKEGIDELLDSIILQAEVMELKPNPAVEGVGHGIVLEANVDKSLGPVVLTIIKSGMLKPGNFIVSERGVHKIRTILDENRGNVKEAQQSQPVWVIGLDDVVETGEVLTFFDNEKQARAKFKEIEHNKSAAISAEATTEGVSQEEKVGEFDDTDLLAQLLGTKQEEDAVKKLNVILKTDTKGTLEAAKTELLNLSDDEVMVNIISEGVGDFTIKDIERAKNSRSIVLGFRVSVPTNVETQARREKVLLRNYEIIYEMIDEVDAALTSLVAPEEEIVEISRAKVKRVFVLSNGQKVAGSEVTKGNVLKGYTVFVERNGEKIGEGKITSLKQNKEEVKEVKKGQECGILIEPKVDVEEGDEVVCYKVEKI